MIVITEQEADMIVEWCSYYAGDYGVNYDDLLTDEEKALYCRLIRAAPLACHQEFCGLKQCQFERKV